MLTPSVRRARRSLPPLVAVCLLACAGPAQTGSFTAAVVPVQTGRFTAAAVPDLSGHYRASGAYATTAAPYQAEVDIVRRGDTYGLRWLSGDLEWSGVGIVDEDRLVVAALGTDGESLAAISYRIVQTSSGPQLVGRWAYPSDRSVSTETLTKGP